MKHPETWLVLGSVIPLLLIFVLPLIGVRGAPVVFFAIVLSFGVHLTMLTLASRAIARAHRQKERESLSGAKGNRHETNQH